eukprot:5560386-Pleurochrysis_carterae.AAC.1
MPRPAAARAAAIAAAAPIMASAKGMFIDGGYAAAARALERPSSFLPCATCACPAHPCAHRAARSAAACAVTSRE